MTGPEDALTERARKRLGRTLNGKWTLDALLGVGGMAAVYAATHRNGHRVAVKMLHPELSVDEIIRRQQFSVFGEEALVGTPNDVKDMLAEYFKRGRVTHLVMGMALTGLAPHLIRSSMDMFAKDVMPAFRR